MNLAIDIGNTSIKKCFFLDNRLRKTSFLNYNKKKLNLLMQFLKTDFFSSDNIYICSVVPEVNKYIIKYFKKLKSKIHFINKQKINFIVDKRVDLEQVGSDRVINVLSVNNLYNSFKNYLIIDLGTATTIDVVINNQYSGGVILPGLKASYSNLIDLASGIKGINFKKNSNLIGRNTQDALLAGFNTGYKLMIESYINKLNKKLKKKFKVIFTGGYANNVLHNNKNFIFRDDLTLLGILYYSQL